MKPYRRPSARVRSSSVLLLLVLATSVLATGCLPGDLLGTSGEAGQSHYTPDYSLSPPAHRSNLPCQDADRSHLCIALNYVSYLDASGRAIVSKSQADSIVSSINTVWSQCQVQYVLENYQAVNPATAGLPESPASMDDLTSARKIFPDSNRLSVVVTHAWTGDLGAQTPNAWTVMPSVGPFGAVIEAPVANVYNLVAHELGHYLNLQHEADPYNVMNPTVYNNSLNIVDTQCHEARATAISFWATALR